MARTLPHASLHAALYTRLTTDADTTGYTVYDASAVPLDAAYPYVTIQLVGGPSRDAKATEINEIRFALAIHTRSTLGSGSTDEAYLMASNVSEALTRSDLALGDYESTSFALVLARPLDSTSVHAYQVDAHMHRDITLTAVYGIQTLA